MSTQPAECNHARRPDAGPARDDEPSHVTLHAGRSAKIVLIAVTAIIFLAWAAVLLSNAFERHPLAASLIFAAGPAWLFAWWFGLYFVHRARLRRSAHLPCIGCGYELIAPAPTGTCPECGSAFERRQLEFYWDQFRPHEPRGDRPGGVD
ncbi:MAG: hypothetical protein ACYTJ0_04855 [Planctomycetota bacterium]|jgi:hypothetical protein